MPQLGDTQQINGVLYEYGIQNGTIPRWIPRRTSNENAEGPGISSDAGNLLALGSDGLPFFAEVTPFNSSIPEVSNGAGANTGNVLTTFIPTETRDYVFEYSGDVQQGGGGISVGTTALGTDLFVASPATGDTDGSRLTITRQENFTPPIPLTAGVTYHITQWAGGGGVIFNHTVSVQQEVFDSNLLPVEDLREVEYEETTNLGFGTNYQLDGDRTWTDLKNEYEHIECNFDVKVSGVDDRVLRTITIATKQLEESSQWRFEYGSAVIDMATNLANGDFSFTGSVIDDITIEIVGVKAQKTVVRPDLLPVVGTNPAARLELTNNTLQSELSLVLGDLGISVDGIAIMPLTSADYVQGGIAAVTADSTNWTRASTGNKPADTNVGFENVPQGRYRYSFSIPEQEDNSTVAANDVADNDRPFPIVLVNGSPQKLHADNTYIEHDDGSTSEYHSSGTVVVPEGGSVQLGLVIEGGDTEEFEFQSAVITTEQGADAILGFFEIEKIDRPVVDQPVTVDMSKQFNLLSDIPSPATFIGGDVLTVSNDPVVENNGTYLVLGQVGQPGTSIIPN